MENRFFNEDGRDREESQDDGDVRDRDRIQSAVFAEEIEDMTDDGRGDDQGQIPQSREVEPRCFLRDDCNYKKSEKVLHVQNEKPIDILQGVFRNGELQAPDDDEEDHHDVVFGFSGLYLICHMHIVAQKPPSERVLWYD